MAPPISATDHEWTVLSDADALGAAMVALNAVSFSPPPPLVYRAPRVYSIAVPPPPLLSNRVLWHSSNILWLQGRLPWNVTRLCLS